MNRLLIIAYCSIFLLATGKSLYGQTQTIDREAVFAGSFYPSDSTALARAIDGYFAEAESFPNDKIVRAIIVPHAGYTYAGVVSASGYSVIPGDAQYENIFIIASSHRVSFEGASVYSAGNYTTPLGTIEVNKEITSQLIEQNNFIEFINEAHMNEHSIEVQIPMIQYHLASKAKIVPIVIGSQSPGISKNLALALLPYFKPENLFVISSDFSHYPSYHDAKEIDKVTCEAILSNSPEVFYNTLRKNAASGIPNLATPACGWTSILTLLYMTSFDRGISFEPILYRNSGDIPHGDKNRVVGYWAIAALQNPTEQITNELSLTENDKDRLLELARKTLISVVKERKYPELNPSDFKGKLSLKEGAFVSLYMNNRLRGCIGTFEQEKPLYMVIQEMTAASALNDKRFVPVQTPELNYIKIEISVLSPLHKISDPSELEIGTHGIYIKKGDKTGTYLPQVAEDRNWTSEEFISHCSMEKAGLGWEGWKDADLYIYEAIVFGEK
jgi:AmmeMemoRadiSam system protein B/AmmeMemoRadiSam system protein A